MKTFIKNPSDEDILDYLWEWADWLDGDTIDTALVQVPTGSLAVASFSIVDGDSVVCFLEGGIVGQSYVVLCTITTAGLRTKSRRIRIDCREH